MPGLLLRQLHRLGKEAQSALGHSPSDVNKDMRQILVTVFNSRPDMYATLLLLIAVFQTGVIGQNRALKTGGQCRKF